MKKAPLFSIEIKDVIKGLIMAGITAIVAGLYKFLDAGTLPSTMAEFKPILISGLIAMISYFAKNFLTNSEDKFAKKEDTTLNLQK